MALDGRQLPRFLGALKALVSGFTRGEMRGVEVVCDICRKSRNFMRERYNIYQRPQISILVFPVSLKLKISSFKHKSPPAARYLDQIRAGGEVVLLCGTANLLQISVIWSKYRAAGGDLSLGEDILSLRDT